MSSFPPPQPHQQPPSEPPPGDKTWKGIAVWAWVIGPAAAAYLIWGDRIFGR